jgi:hypothetical protein
VLHPGCGGIAALRREHVKGNGGRLVDGGREGGRERGHKLTFNQRRLIHTLPAANVNEHGIWLHCSYRGRAKQLRGHANPRSQPISHAGKQNPHMSSCSSLSNCDPQRNPCLDETSQKAAADARHSPKCIPITTMHLVRCRCVRRGHHNVVTLCDKVRYLVRAVHLLLWRTLTNTVKVTFLHYIAFKRRAWLNAKLTTTPSLRSSSVSSVRRLKPSTRILNALAILAQA